MSGGRRPFTDFVELLGTVLVLAIAIRTFFVLPARVPTPSMAPALIPGQWIFIERCGLNFRAPQIGDCVVLDIAAMGIPGGLGTDTSDFAVKRLAGMPGDRVRLRDDRKLEVNGLDAGLSSPKLARQQELRGRPATWEFRGYLNQAQVDLLGGPHGVAPRFPDGLTEIQVGQGQVVVLGDNSLASQDSRVWGPIPARSVVGVVRWR